jgi:uncharacterized protein (DUF1800 family)
MKAWHDSTDVTVMNKHYQAKDDYEEGLSFLNDLAASSKTAHYISQKLCRHFVQDPPPPACIARLAKIYLDSDGDLREIYRTLFTSPEFWSASTVQSRIKKPFEFLASSLRAMASNIQINNESIDAFANILLRADEPLYGCRAPSGYADENDAWINPSMVFGRSLAAPVLASLANPERRLQRDRISKDLSEVMHSPVSAETETEIKAALAESQQKAMALMVAAPEFQWR